MSIITLTIDDSLVKEADRAAEHLEDLARLLRDVAARPDRKADRKRLAEFTTGLKSLALPNNFGGRFLDALADWDEDDADEPCFLCGRRRCE